MGFEFAYIVLGSTVVELHKVVFRRLISQCVVGNIEALSLENRLSIV